MPDDKSKRGPQDRRLINLGDDHEIRYWCEKFSVSAEELAKAVLRVGSRSKDVEAELKNHARKSGPEK